MDPETNWAAIKFITEGERILMDECNVANVIVGNDFAHYKKTMLEVRGELSEHFDISYMDDLDAIGTWFMCENTKGQLVAAQALRFEDLRGISLELSLRRRIERIHGGVTVESAPILENVKGRACYHGGMWIRPGSRGKKLAPIFGRMLHAYAYTQFKPTIIYGLVAEALIYHGYGERMGFTHVSRYARDWHQTPNFPESHFLVALEERDFRWQWDEPLEALAAA